MQEARLLIGDVMNVSQNPIGMNKDRQVRLFSWLPTARARGNGQIRKDVPFPWK